MMRKKLSPLSPPVACTVEHVTERRMVRVGACPVLEVVVVYPVVTVAEDGERLRRFNRAYREAAEAFTTWALEAPAMQARAEFEAFGAGAAYRFDRRCIVCRFEATEETAGHRAALCVTRTVTYGRRRAGEMARFVEQWLWRFSDGTVWRQKDVKTAP